MTLAAPRTPRRILLMAAVAVVAVVPLAFPYATLDPAASRIPVTSGLHYALLVAHVATAGVALVLGPLQFISGAPLRGAPPAQGVVPRLLANRRLHRALGRTYLLAGVVPSALVGIPVAILSGRPLTQVGLTIPFVGWLVTAALAVAAVRRGDVAAHRRWMMRNYALTFLAITARVLVPLMLVVSIVAGHRADVTTLVPVGQVAAWVVDLAIVELVLLRSR